MLISFYFLPISLLINFSALVRLACWHACNQSHFFHGIYLIIVCLLVIAFESDLLVSSILVAYCFLHILKSTIYLCIFFIPCQDANVNSVMKLVFFVYPGTPKQRYESIFVLSALTSPANHTQLISRRSDPAIKKTLSMMVHSCFFFLFLHK